MKTTSIQISVKHRDLLKKFCESTGYNMSSFIEKLIEERTSKNSTPPVIFDGILPSVNGNTAFGIYDAEEQFCKHCYASTNWVVRRLGYPILSIEMNPNQFYSAFEESVCTYNSLRSHEFKYTWINDKGREWVRRYFLAICKEILGMIRMKYQTIPTPGGEIQLDGNELRNEARVEKDILRSELML